VPGLDRPPAPVSTPARPPVALPPPPAPRPQLLPADNRTLAAQPFLGNSVPPAPLPPATPFVAPAPATVPTLNFTKPAGSDSPVTAQPAVRRYGAPPAVAVPVVAQQPDGRQPSKSPTGKPADPAKAAEEEKEQSRVAPIATLDPKVPPIARARAFRFENDKELDRRIIAELIEFAKRTEGFKYQPSSFEMPEPSAVGQSSGPYVPKTASYSPLVSLVEPGYVVHRRLYFEEKNAERNGWDLGFIQPVASTLVFYKDALLYPMHVASNLGERYDTSAGKCPPGNAVPLYLYPEEITLFGATVGAVTYVAAGYIFPH
jgi:hypothetical protein